MATLEELIGWVSSTVDDPSLDEEDITAIINEALDEIASVVLIPDLEASDTVTTVVDGTSIPRPADFDRNLYGCAIAGQIAPKVLTSMKLMQDRFPDIEADDETGSIELVCIRGEDVVYHPVPTTATDMVLRYYRKPTPLALDGDSPSWLPARMHRQLIVSYVCMVLFDDIEDGMEGAKVNTARHEARYNKALVKLEESVKHGQSRPDPPRLVNQWNL